MSDNDNDNDNDNEPDHVPGWTFDLALWREYCEQIEAEPPRAADNTTHPGGSWRDLPPTARQLRMLSRGWRSTDYKKPTTRGEASDMISAIVGKK